MPIDRIVIAGGGVAGWLAASMLARALEGSPTAISLVDHGGADDSLGIASEAETLTPRALERSSKAGYDEHRLLASTDGSYTLGTALSGWTPGAPAFLPYGCIGAPMGPVAFHQLAARLRREGTEVRLPNYALAALCAQTGRFAQPTTGDRSVLSTLDYGAHVGTARLREYLRADAVARGVAHVVGRVDAPVRNADGTIAALATDTGVSCAGDLFVDAMGPSTPLGGITESWAESCPFDRVTTSVRHDAADPLPYAHLAADATGWCRATPLAGRLCEVRAFRDTDNDDSDIGRPLAPGRRADPWSGNCVAIGGAAAVVDPVTGSQLDLAQAAIVRLIGLLPHDRNCAIEAAEYNRVMIEELDGQRDLTAYFYCAAPASMHGWQTRSYTTTPPRLAHKIALYESCGRVALHDGETLDEAGWVALFDAFGLRARRYDALADGITRAAIDYHFTRIREVMLQAVAALPPHGDYLRALRS